VFVTHSGSTKFVPESLVVCDVMSSLECATCDRLGSFAAKEHARSSRLYADLSRISFLKPYHQRRILTVLSGWSTFSECPREAPQLGTNNALSSLVARRIIRPLRERVSSTIFTSRGSCFFAKAFESAIYQTRRDGANRSFGAYVSCNSCCKSHCICEA